MTAPKAGPLKTFRRDGSLESVGTMRGGKRVGACRFYHHDGTTLKASGRFDAQGRFTGLWKWWASNGALRQVGPFKEGLQHGLWKPYYGGTTQLVDVGRYVEGKRTGTWIFYDRPGNVKRTKTFPRSS